MIVAFVQVKDLIKANKKIISDRKNILFKMLFDKQNLTNVKTLLINIIRQKI